MKYNSIQQEVLLMAGTSFLSRQFLQEEDNGKQLRRSENDQLEEACWNGLLQLMLPEIFEYPFGNKDLFMWKVTVVDKFVGVEMGNIPAEKESEHSIDPAAFLPTKLLS